MRFKDFVQLNENVFKRVELRRVGKNGSGKERILLYATENTNLHDYAVCVMDDDEFGTIYRFPKESIMEKDDYICLFTGTANRNVYVNGHRIKTFSMGYQKDVFTDGSSVCLIKISNTVYKPIERR